MANGFVITAQIQLRGPANIRPVVSNIQKQLQGVNARVNVQLPRGFSSQVNGITSQINNLNNAINQISQNRSAVTGINQIGTAVNKTTNQIQQGKSAAFEFGEAIGQAGRKFAAFSIAAGTMVSLIASIKDGISSAIQFQHEMVRLEQVGGNAGNIIGGISKEITNLSTELGVSSRELSTISTTLRQAGLSGEETRLALKGIAESAVAPTFTDIENTVEGAIAAMQQFNVQAKDMRSVLGSINRVSADFAVESDDIVHTIRRSGGAFKAAGGDLNELMALFTSVRQTTRESAETIASGFNTIFARLQRPDTVQQLQQMGVQLRYTADEAKAFGKTEGDFVGPYEAIRRLNSALDSVPPASAQYAAIVEEIGGFRQVSKVIPLIQQFGVAEKALGVAMNGTTSLTQSNLIAQQSFIVQLNKLKEEFLDLFRVLGNNKVLQTYAMAFVSLARGAVQLAKVLEPLIPLIATLATVKTFQTLGLGLNRDFGRGLRSGAKSNKLAAGGIVPGVGNSDSVPAMLTPGEFVIRKSAAKSIGYSNLAGINHYASGGMVNRKKRAYAFDFDQVLSDFSKEDAEKIDALKKDKKFSEAFGMAYLNPDIIGRSDKLPLSKLAAKRSQQGHDVYILTARSSGEQGSIRGAISDFARKNGIDVKEILTVGDREDRVPGKKAGTTRKASTPEKKRMALEELLSSYDNIKFYDDKKENIESLADIDKIKPRQVRDSRRMKRFAYGGRAFRNPREDQRFANELVESEENRGIAEILESWPVDAVELYYNPDLDSSEKKNVLKNKYGINLTSQSFSALTGKKTKLEKFEKGTSHPEQGQIYIPFGNDSVGAIGQTPRSDAGEIASYRSAKDVINATSNTSVKKVLGGIDKVNLRFTRYAVSNDVTEDFAETIQGPVLDAIKGSFVGAFGDVVKNDIRFTKSEASSIEGVLFEKYIRALTQTPIGQPDAPGDAVWDFPGGLNPNSSINKVVYPSPMPHGPGVYLDGKIKPAHPGVDASLMGKYLTSNVDKLLASTQMNAGGKVVPPAIQKFSTGGSPTGTDTVPALLTPGEFVINRQAASRIGYNNLNKLNHYHLGGDVQRFQKGGRVFKYNAMDQTGKEFRGRTIEASTEEEAKQLLRQQGFFVTKISKSKTPDYLQPPTVDTPRSYQQAQRERQAKNQLPEKPLNFFTGIGAAVRATGSALGGTYGRAALAATRPITGAVGGAYRKFRPGTTPNPPSDSPAETFSFGNKQYQGHEVIPGAFRRHDDGTKTPLTAAEFHAEMNDNKGYGPEARAGIFRRGIPEHSDAYRNAQARASAPDAKAAAAKLIQDEFSNDSTVRVLDQILDAIKDGDGKIVSAVSSSDGPSGSGIDIGGGKTSLKSRLGGRFKKFGGAAAILAAQYVPQLVESSLGGVEKPTGVATGISGGINAILGNRTSAQGVAKVGGAVSGAVSGAAAGAATGALLGPQAALLGGVAGGILGIVNSLKEADSKIKALQFGKSLDKFSLAVERAANNTEDTLASDNIADLRRGITNIRSAAANESDPQQFYAQNLPRELLSNMQASLLKTVKFGKNDTSEERISKFLNAADGLGRSLINLQLEADNINFDELRPQIEKITKHSAYLQEREQQEKELTITLQKQNRNFAVLTQAISNATLSIGKMQSGLDATFSVTQGAATSIPVPDFSEELKNITTADPRQFSAAIDFFTNAIGNGSSEIVTAFGDTAKGINLASNGLPTALHDLVSQGLQGGDVGEGLRNALDRVGAEIPDDIKKALGNAITGFTEFDDKNLFKNIAADVNKFADDLSKKAFPNVLAVLEEGPKHIVERFRQLDTDLARYQDIGKRAGESDDKAGQLAFESLKMQNAILGRRVGAPINERGKLPTDVTDYLFNRTQERLTGRTGQAALDPRAITQELRGLSTRMQEAASRRDRALLTPGTYNRDNALKASEDFSKLSSKAGDLQEALGRLADSASRTAELQKELADINQEETNRLGVAEEYLTSSISDRMKMERSLGMAQAAADQGNLAGFGPSQISDIMSILNKFSNIPIRGQFTGTDIKENLLRNSFPGANLPEETEGKRQSLENQIIARMDTAVQAQNGLTSFLRTSQADFLRDLKALHANFFTALERNLQVAKATDVQNTINEKQGQINAATPQKEAIHRLSNMGIKDYDRFRGISNSDSFKKVEETRSNLKRTELIQTDAMTGSVINPDAKKSIQGMVDKLSIKERSHEISDDMGRTRVVKSLGVDPDMLSKISTAINDNLLELPGDRSKVDSDVTQPVIKYVAEATEQGKKVDINRLISNQIFSVYGEIGKKQLADYEEAANRLKDANGLTLTQIYAMSVSAKQFREDLESLRGFTGPKDFNDNLEKTAVELKNLEDSLKSVNGIVDDLGEKLGLPPRKTLPEAKTKASGGLMLPTSIYNSVFKPKGTDTIPAMLSPGEYVVNAKSTRANKDLLEKVNQASGPVQYHAFGGIVRTPLEKWNMKKFKDDNSLIMEKREKRNKEFQSDYMPHDLSVKAALAERAERMEESKRELKLKKEETLRIMRATEKKKTALSNKTFLKNLASGPQTNRYTDKYGGEIKLFKDRLSNEGLSERSFSDAAQRDLSINKKTYGLIGSPRKNPKEAKALFRLAQETKQGKHEDENAVYRRQYQYYNTLIKNYPRSPEAEKASRLISAVAMKSARADLNDASGASDYKTIQARYPGTDAFDIAGSRLSKYVSPVSKVETPLVKRKPRLTTQELKQQAFIQRAQQINSKRIRQGVPVKNFQEYAEKNNLQPITDRRTLIGEEAYNAEIEQVLRTDKMFPTETSEVIGRNRQSRQRIYKTTTEPTPDFPRVTTVPRGRQSAENTNSDPFEYWQPRRRTMNRREFLAAQGIFSPQDRRRMMDMRMRDYQAYSATRGTDTIPAMLSPGEYVVNSKSTRENRQLLDNINRRKPIHRQQGGPVGPSGVTNSSAATGASMSLSQDSIDAIRSFNAGFDGSIARMESSMEQFSGGVETLNGVVAGMKELIGPLNLFAQNIQLIRAPFDAFNTSSTNLGAGMVLFNKSADTLAAALNNLSNLPSTITVQGTTQVNVVFTGAEAFNAIHNQLQEDITKAVINKLKPEIISDIKNGSILV